MNISFKYFTPEKWHCIWALGLKWEKKLFDMIRIFEWFENLNTIIQYWGNKNFQVDYPNPDRLRILENIHQFKNYFHFHWDGLNRIFWGIEWDTLYIMYIDPKWEIDRKAH